jgi:hypothetical protein
MMILKMVLTQHWLLLKAKQGYDLSYAAHQLATYLAAVQNCRARKGKDPACALGITTDGCQYKFWFMDSNLQLTSSVTFDWRCQKNTIIAWIDKMLADAIPRNWERDFRRRHGLTSGIPFAITVPRSSQIVVTACHNGRTILIVEYDADGDEDEDEDEVEESSGEN